MDMMKDVPVLLLTGYLGSGKTTLLNRILTNEKGIKFAVIVNDIGEVNIDADLIQQGGVVNQKDDSLVALQNGCICCTLKMDLVEQLHDIVAMKRFDYIVIEASGICEPAPIAQTICSFPTLGPQYIKDGVPRLDSIVTVVDALRMRDEFEGGDALTKKNIDEEDIENLVIQQIEFCNTILLNKASEVSADELLHVRKIIRAIQPKAEIISCDYGNVDLERLLNTHKFVFNEVATSATFMVVMMMVVMATMVVVLMLMFVLVFVLVLMLVFMFMFMSMPMRVFVLMLMCVLVVVMMGMGVIGFFHTVYRNRHMCAGDAALYGHLPAILHAGNAESVQLVHKLV